MGPKGFDQSNKPVFEITSASCLCGRPRLTRSRGYKNISCSTQLSVLFFFLINVKIPTIIGILTNMSRKNSILGLSEPEKKFSFLIFVYL